MREKEEDIVSEGRRLVELAAEWGLAIRLLGGVGVSLICRGASRPPFARPYLDLDVVTATTARRAVAEFFEACGYAPHVMFNKLQAHRMYFSCETYDRHVDVFFSEFVMCHRYRFTDRSFSRPYTLPPDELLLTKLQIVQLTEKDLKDVAALLDSFDITDAAGGAGFHDAVTRATQDGWGFYKTVSMNLDRVEDYLALLALDADRKERALSRLAALRASIAGAPKSLRWRMRALVGERVRWYELPEDPTRSGSAVG